MSKTFEVILFKNRKAGECGIHWPSWWPRVVNRVAVEAYEADDGNLGPNVQEHAICISSDATWNIILGLDDPADPRVREIDDDEANTKGRLWKPQVPRILDPQRVIEICTKIGKGQGVTAVERKALDPDDPEESGIGLSREFNIAEIRSRRDD